MEREFEYEFTTNSLGRVQHTELDSVKPSILFLGDSFTEGQGAVPWFYTLESQWPSTSPYQLVNGAVLGTGVEDWGRLYNDLSGTLNIRKAVVIYIGDDWQRPVWQFPAQTLACLHSAAACIGDENFYGLPADSAQAAAQIERIAQSRIRQLSALRAGTNVIQRSAVYKHLWTPLIERVKRGANAPPSIELVQFEVARRTVKELVGKLGRGNVLFVYLPQRHELEPGPNLYGKMANDFVTENGYSLMDGRKECGLRSEDYHPHDGHPNARGYAKIEACVQRATQKAFGNDGVPAVTGR